MHTILLTWVSPGCSNTAWRLLFLSGEKPTYLGPHNFPGTQASQGSLPLPSPTRRGEKQLVPLLPTEHLTHQEGSQASHPSHQYLRSLQLSDLEDLATAKHTTASDLSLPFFLSLFPVTHYQPQPEVGYEASPTFGQDGYFYGCWNMREDGVRDGHVGLFDKGKYWVWRIFQAGVEDMHLTRNECISN